jgi:hypothetical protein
MYNTQQEISKKIDPTGPTSTMSFIQIWMSKRNGHIILRYIGFLDRINATRKALLPTLTI